MSGITCHPSFQWRPQQAFFAGARALATRCVFQRAVAVGIRPSPGFAVTALRWRHRLAYTRRANLCSRERRVPVADPFSFSRPREPWFAWEWLADVVFAETWRWRGVSGGGLAGGCDARPGGYGTAGTHPPPRVRFVDRTRGDNGGGERIEHTLPGAAARLFDSVLHTRVVGPRRRSRAPPAVSVAAGADDRAVDESACRLCRLAGHAGTAAASLWAESRLVGRAPVRRPAVLVLPGEPVESLRLALTPPHCALLEFSVGSWTTCRSFSPRK